MTGEVRVGHYRVQDVLGAGSFATVHRAVDDRLADEVVIKILAENHSLNPEIRERFIAEGRSLRRVASPHVVAVHDIGESDRQQPYLVLELADRGTLADRVVELRAEGWVAETADILAVARSLAAALRAVHTAHLVHRDLSPRNVLLTTTAPDPQGGPAAGRLVRPDERILLADLGMCKDLALSSGLTVAGGTSGFRPPEQSEGPSVVDTRADLWSLSSLVRWLAEGADLPPALDAVLDRSLAVDPAARHPDVATWLAEVEEALAPASPEPAPDPTAEVIAARGWRRPVLALLLATAVALGAVVGVLSFQALTAAPDRSGESSVAIEGPARVEVGATVTFTAVVAEVETWVWTLPSGAYVVGDESVTITARTPGEARVVLTARAADGTELETTHRVVVDDATE